jgi:hypothetical protein
MDRLGLSPWSPLIMGTVSSVATLIAVFGFGAHPLILLPVMIVSMTLTMGIQSRAQRRSGRF